MPILLFLNYSLYRFDLWFKPLNVSIKGNSFLVIIITVVIINDNLSVEPK